MAAGAGFLALGGPKKIVRGSGARSPTPRPARRPAASLLPDEVERIVRRLGDDGAVVRATLEHDPPGHVDQKRKEREKERRRWVKLALRRAACRWRAWRRTSAHRPDPSPDPAPLRADARAAPTTARGRNGCSHGGVDRRGHGDEPGPARAPRGRWTGRLPSGGTWARASGGMADAPASRSRCRASGVSVRPDLATDATRVQRPGVTLAGRRPPGFAVAAAASFPHLQSLGDERRTTTRSRARLLEIELLQVLAEIGDSIRRLSRRTRVPGFRPRKRPLAPQRVGIRAVLDEARISSSRPPTATRWPKPGHPPGLSRGRGHPGRGGQALIFKATVAVRLKITLGDYRGLHFG